MFGWSKIDRERRRIVREDRRHLAPRVRRFLRSYLLASDMDKARYYDVVAGVSVGCHPKNHVSYLENLRVAELTGQTANAIARHRLLTGKDGYDDAEGFITDAFATTAVAYRRAAGNYVDNKRMQKLGTAAVHLLTMAVSRTMAQRGESSDEDTEQDG